MRPRFAARDAFAALAAAALKVTDVTLAATNPTVLRRRPLGTERTNLERRPGGFLSVRTLLGAAAAREAEPNERSEERTESSHHEG